MREIFSKILYEIEKNNDLVLVTLTDSDGSAPRKTGAQMLVGEKGLILGTIGGGAVEKLSIEKAQDLVKQKRSNLHPFFLHTNDKEDIGMICGGNVTALFQFISAGDPLWKEICIKAIELFTAQKGGWFVQRLDGGKPALFGENAELICGESPECEIPEGSKALNSGAHFWMPIPVAERVIIFGGGHIAAALVPLLSIVGFRSWVFDDRAEYTTADRFPQAEKCITGDFMHIGDSVSISDKDYVVIMTNGHKNDFETELQVLRGPFAYIGVIGSRRKTAAVNEKLRAQGITENKIAQVHTPIGTAIKAVTPEEIAVSIAGELILVRAERREAAGEEKHHCPMH